ncbi:nucleotidyltransferase family protein [Rothia mucilaginosa]|uniref:nucleotidyltransferase family protein n=1 Tax=Rothia mucilaginosa TaxID=43675 RepID=UPI0028D6BEC8|nr:nucleotidyltransferase family protein [Rothia mucilaginosa]
MTTHSASTPEPLTTPLAARIRLAHAYFQHIADAHSIDVLHIKGYAFSQEIYRKGRYSSDADLLVRPSQVDRFVKILLADGWRIQAHFETGSVFEHAMTLYHASWGLTDIHRFFPGLGRHGDYEKTFDRVWAARHTRFIAHRPCTVPSDLDACLIVVLHRARAASRYSADINYLVNRMSYADWQRLKERANELDSNLAYSAAMGGLEQYRGDRDYLLWLSVSQDVPHYIQWIGRLRSATTLRDKLRTLKNIFFVNKDHLAMQLGRTPTRAEVRTKFFERFGIEVKK